MTSQPVGICAQGPGMVLDRGARRKRRAGTCIGKALRSGLGKAAMSGTVASRIRYRMGLEQARNRPGISPQ